MTGLVLASLLPSAVASASFLGMELSMRDEVLVTELTVDGYPGRRYPVPFDPAFMDAELEEAWVASPTGGRIDVPAWAVDTLSVVSGMPSALVVAFPGAMGEGGFLRATVTDRSSAWSRGAWFDFTAPEWPDSVRIVFRDSGREPVWSGEGYEFSMDGRDAVFTAGPSAGRLSVSCFTDWDDLYEFLRTSFDEAANAPVPSSVRGAAIEAAASRADGTMIAARLRTILCNSFRLKSAGHPASLLEVDPLETLMRTRSADRLEMALVAVSILEAMDMDAELLFGAADRAEVPIPSDWDRPLVSIALADGRVLLIDPSAYLNSAFHVPDRESMDILGPGCGRPLEPPAGGPEDFWRETWTVAPDGSFALEVLTGGSADSLLRHRLAGLDGPSASASLALWLLQGGGPAAIESLETTDLFDLSTPASLCACGRLPDIVAPGSQILLPRLPVRQENGTQRIWNLPARIAAFSRGLSLSGGGFSLEEVDGGPACPAALFEM